MGRYHAPPTMLDVLVYGLLRGATFAVVAFGFSLVTGVLGVVNMAHGVFVVFGALATYSFHVDLGLSLPIAVVCATFVTGVLAALFQVLFIARVQATNPLMVLVQTFGLAIVCAKLFDKTWGAGEKMIRAEFPYLRVIEWGDVVVPTIEVVIFLIAMASAAALLVMLNFTTFGRSIRACRDNPRSASLLGIDPKAIYLLTMIICGLWTGLAGALLIMIKPIAPYMQLQWTVDAFLIVVAGGMGSIGGVLVGGFMFGVLSYAASYYYPAIAPALIFSALILLLVFRPNGLFGIGVVTRK